ncbi:tetratricopeptide repeat protein [Actinocorallia populi]|uniref:tetratricopeptide repeat protein n=1 Tax=Actinocorallia populi TaxID=2079200 RepID=UPI0018E4F550|nr:tetratricopeptide repeat protein [Actinocorallia populi]
MIRNPGEGTFWAALGDSDRKALLAIGHQTAVPARGTLCNQGIPARDVLLILDGHAKEQFDARDGTEAILELLGPGELEGDLAVWGHPQRASVVALTELSVLRIDSRKFARFVTGNPRVTDALMEAMAHRWARAGRRLALNGAGRAVRPGARVAFHLLELALRTGRVGPQGIRVPMPLNQAELANWVGISRESLVRCYARWRGSLIDTSQPRWLLLPDLEGLRQEAGPWADEDWEALERSLPGPRVSLAVRPPVATDHTWLPAGGEHFTGRRAELARLSFVLAARPPGVVIQGMAGVGKTALALHWTHLESGRFPDGRIFVDLRGPTKAVTPVEALGQILRRLGVPGDQLPAEEAELVALYQSLLADRRVLIVLDNASGRDEQIRPLIPSGSGGFVLVTARQRLTGTGLPMLELGEMAPQEAVELLAEVVGRGRVEPERQAAQELARECAHLPLALRIAAARLAASPGESIASTVRELSGRDRLSAFALPDDPHGALRAAFEISYDTLDPVLRTAFRCLGLNVGPDFSIPSAAALLGTDEETAARRVRELEQAFLVVSATADRRRYRMHDLLRDFARELAEREDSETDRRAVRHRLLSHHLRAARAAEEALRGLGRTEAVAWFEAERRCLVSAVRHAARLGLHPIAYGLAAALYDFLEFRRYSEDNITVHRIGLVSARTNDAWAVIAVMLHHLSAAHRELGRCVRAIGYGEDARRAFQALGDRSGEAAVLDTLALVYTDLGGHPAALEYAGQALALHRELAEPDGEARALDTLARNLQRLGRYDEAYEHAHRALDLRRARGDRRGEAETLLNLARVHRYRGNFQQAAIVVFEALDANQELEHRHGEAEARTELARVHQQLGNRELSRLDAGRALETYRSVGARLGEGETLVILARIAIGETRHMEAITHCADALPVLRAIGHRSGEAEATALFGIAYYWLGRYPEARENLQRALEIRRQIGDLHGEAHDLDYLGRVARRMGRTDEAVLLGLEGLSLSQELGAREREAGALGSLARTYLRIDWLEEALNAAELGLEIRRQTGDLYGMGTALDTYALILRRVGRPHQAAEISQEALAVLVEAGDHHGRGAALVNLAETRLHLDDATAARACAESARALSVELGDRRNEAAAHHVLGLVLVREKQPAQACGHFERETGLRAEMGDHGGRIQALEALARCQDALGRAEAAADTRRRIAALGRWPG